MIKLSAIEAHSRPREASVGSIATNSTFDIFNTTGVSASPKRSPPWEVVFLPIWLAVSQSFHPLGRASYHTPVPSHSLPLLPAICRTCSMC